MVVRLLSFQELPQQIIWKKTNFWNVQSKAHFFTNSKTLTSLDCPLAQFWQMTHGRSDSQVFNPAIYCGVDLFFLAPLIHSTLVLPQFEWCEAALQTDPWTTVSAAFGCKQDKCRRRHTQTKDSNDILSPNYHSTTPSPFHVLRPLYIPMAAVEGSHFGPIALISDWNFRK